MPSISLQNFSILKQSEKFFSAKSMCRERNIIFPLHWRPISKYEHHMSPLYSTLTHAVFICNRTGKTDWYVQAFEWHGDRFIKISHAILYYANTESEDRYLSDLHKNLDANFGIQSTVKTRTEGRCQKKKLYLHQASLISKAANGCPVRPSEEFEEVSLFVLCKWMDDFPQPLDHLRSIFVSSKQKLWHWNLLVLKSVYLQMLNLEKNAFCFVKALLVTSFCNWFHEPIGLALTGHLQTSVQRSDERHIDPKRVAVESWCV